MNGDQLDILKHRSRFLVLAPAAHLV